MATEKVIAPKATLPRTHINHSGESPHAHQYGPVLDNTMYFQEKGYGNQVTQAMYGYRQTIPIQAKTSFQQKATPSPQQKQIAQVQRKEEEREDLPGDSLKETIQTKLTVGSPDDPYEKEADAVADHVMHMPEQAVQQKCAHCEATQRLLQRKNIEATAIVPEPLIVQRKCAACEAEEKLVQRKSLFSNIAPHIQTKGTEGGAANDEISTQIQASQGRGNPMQEHTRNFMESRFGVDFGNVRVHTGAEAIQLSQQLNAQAFATGNDIYFNQGKYSPESSEGKHLLAHELTHVVQQKNGLQRTLQRTCAVEPPAADEMPYITGSGANKMAYSFTDSGGANAFIKKNPGKNLTCHEVEKAGKRVYVIYQKNTPAAEPPKPRYTPLNGAELDLDLSGNITSSRELHLSFQSKDNTVQVAFKHVAGTKTPTIQVSPDNIELKGAVIYHIGSTDGIHALEIAIAGPSTTQKDKYDLFTLKVVPGIGPGKYSFNTSKESDQTQLQLIDLGVPENFIESKTGSKLIVPTGQPTKEGGTFKFDYKVGPKKEIEAALYIIKNPDEDAEVLFSFSAAALVNSATGSSIQTQPSRKMSVSIPVSFEELDIEKTGETNTSVSYRFLPPQYGRGFMITYEMNPKKPQSLDAANAIHGFNIYPIDTVKAATLATEPPANARFRQQGGEWQYGYEKRTEENFRMESAKHAFDKLSKVVLPKNEIVDLLNEMSLIVMMAVKENISSKELFTQWVEFSYGVTAYGEDAAKGDDTARQWLNDKADIFIKALIKEVGNKGTETTVNANSMGPAGGTVTTTSTNKYTGASHREEKGVGIGAMGPKQPAKALSGPFDNVRALISSSKFTEAILLLRNSYYLWIEDQLLSNTNADKATKEKFQAYGYHLSYKRRLRDRLGSQKKPLQKIKAIYYPDLGNIKDENDQAKNVADEIKAIPLDVYYQDSGDEWTVYNFTTLTQPGKINDFERTWEKQGGEFAPPQELFELLTHDKGIGKGYIHYQAPTGEGGVVRVDHPWTLGEVLLTAGAVIGLIALALTGIGLLAEGAAAASIGGAALVVGDIAAITVAVGASVKLGEDYAQGAPITGLRIADTVIDITTAILPGVRSLRSIASLRKYKGMYILMDIKANSQLLAKLDAAANITAIVVTTSKGAEELAGLSKALEEGKIDEATFYWAVFRNVSLGVINVLLLHSSLKTLKGRSIGNTTIDEIVKRATEKNLLELRETAMYSQKNLEAGIEIMQESSSVYRAMVLESLSTDKHFENAIDVLCYLGKKGRGGPEDIITIDGKLRRAIDVLIEGKFFGKKLSIPQGFTGSKAEALDTVSRDFNKFSTAIVEGVHQVPGLQNAEVRMQGSAVMGITRPKQSGGAVAEVPKPAEGKAIPEQAPKTPEQAVPKEKAAESAKTWDYDLAIMVAPDDYAKKLASIFQGKAKYKDKKKGEIDLSKMTPDELRTIGQKMAADKAKPEPQREFNSVAHTFGNGIVSGKANMSKDYFPEIVKLRDAVQKEFNIPGLDLSVIAKNSGFDSTPFITLQKTGN